MTTQHNSLTMREIAEVERLSGLSMNQLDEQAPVALYMAAVGTVLRQRVEPDFTFEQALDMTLSDLQSMNATVEDAGDAEDPKGEGSAADTPTTG